MSFDRQMTKERATEFFAEFFRGDHHFPSELIEWGYGWAMKTHGELATWDFDQLTRLVVMAHDDSIKVTVIPKDSTSVIIAINPRPIGNGANEHPVLDWHIENIRKGREKWKNENKR